MILASSILTKPVLISDSLVYKFPIYTVQLRFFFSKKKEVINYIDRSRKKKESDNHLLDEHPSDPIQFENESAFLLLNTTKKENVQ